MREIGTAIARRWNQLAAHIATTCSPTNIALALDRAILLVALLTLADAYARSVGWMP